MTHDGHAGMTGALGGGGRVGSPLEGGGEGEAGCESVLATTQEEDRVDQI